MAKDTKKTSKAPEAPEGPTFESLSERIETALGKLGGKISDLRRDSILSHMASIASNLEADVADRGEAAKKAEELAADAKAKADEAQRLADEAKAAAGETEEKK